MAPEQGYRRAEAAPSSPIQPGDRRRGPVSGLVLGRPFGIPVRLHWTFFLLPLLVVLADAGSGAGVLIAGLVWIVALFASVVVHEFAHCLVARRRGSTVRDIVLFPLGGVSEIDELPETPSDELAIAVVGPLTSAVLGAVLLSFAWAAGAHVWPPTLFAGNWWARLGWLNLLLAAFNLVPALPMDGGRVLRAWLSRTRPRPVATAQAARVARVLGVVMMVIGVLYDFWLLLIGFFVILGAGAEVSATRRPPSGPGARAGPAPGDDTGPSRSGS